MSSSPDSETTSNGTMDLFEHLQELRSRLVACAAAIFVAGSVAYVYSPEIFLALTVPFEAAFAEHELIGIAPQEAFVLKIKVAFFAGIVFASPFLFLQLWKFITPGLYDHERKLAIPFLVSATALFLIGVNFCFYLVLPFAYDFFFAQYESLTSVTPTVRISEHLSLVIKALVGFGVVFEMPVLAFFLGRLGIITDTFLIQGARYAVVIIFLVAALLTPPDIITQLLMAGPLLLLYALSILLVRFAQPKSTLEEGPLAEPPDTASKE